MSSKRILIFSLAYYPVVGGAEIAIKEITDRVRDIQFDMITMRFNSKDRNFEMIGNVHVHRVGNSASYINKILFVPRATLLAWKLNRKNEYDKFWAMMTNMLFPIGLLRMIGNRTPYILTLQDGDPFERVFKRLRIRLFAPLLRAGFKHASVVQTISNFLAGWARQMGYKGRLEVVPNGVDVKKFEGEKTNHDGTVLVTTSRLFPKNAVGDVIDALEFLPENVRFHILGTGPLEKELKLKAKKLKSSEARVKFLGFVDLKEIPKYLHESDIFIRPSLSEGQGSSFIEAMAAGLPVIATDVGGIPDFLFDPDKTPHKAPTGLFVKVHDPKDIARQVTRLMKSPNLRESLITNAKRLVREKYDWNLIAEEMRSKVFK